MSKRRTHSPEFKASVAMEAISGRKTEVGAFYWTVPAPDIVNSGQEEQGSVSV